MHKGAFVTTKKTAASRGIVIKKDGFACTECERKFDRASALGNHMRGHGIKSKAELHREKMAKRNPGSQQIQVATSASTERVMTSYEQAGKERTSTIDPLLYAITLGQIKELCRRIAEEHDVPTKLFTRQFAELFLRETRR
jgi:hypothetical protein